MMQEVEILKTIQELICSFFSEEQFTLSANYIVLLFVYLDCKMCGERQWIKLLIF